MMTRRLAALAAAVAFLALAATAAAQPTLVAKWGSQGSGDGQFNVPWDLAVGRDGSVYVADSQNNRIQRFSPTGDFLGKWGASGTNPGQFQFPRAVAADAAGNVYVGDEGSHRIQKFGLDGSFQTQWGGGGSGAGQFSNPIAIAVDGAGNVYVGEFSGHRIQKFDSNGSFQRMWGWDVDAAQPGTGFEICTTAPNCKAGVYGSGPGQFGRPVGLAVDSAGNLYEADRDNDRVQRFSSNGDFLGTWGSAGSGDGQFEGPEDVAVDPAGNVSVADDTNYRIQKFTPSGGYLSQFNTVAPGETFRPASVIFEPQGDIYILGGLPSGVTILRAREGAAQAPRPGPTSPTPRPELGVSVVAEAVRGQVFVSVGSGAARASQAQTVPGLKGRRFVPLREAREIPVGSFLDTRRGSVRLVSAHDRAGNTQTGDFAAGVFQVLQSRRASARGLTELSLTGSSFRGCRARHSLASLARHRLSRRTIRRLRSNARGRFRTRGRYSSATIRGTTWNTLDRCDGTLTRVRRGRVVVRDLRRRRNVTVRAGRSYLARARR